MWWPDRPALMSGDIAGGVPIPINDGNLPIFTDGANSERRKNSRYWGKIPQLGENVGCGNA
jgi:hypothetical protein